MFVNKRRTAVLFFLFVAMPVIVYGVVRIGSEDSKKPINAGNSGSQANSSYQSRITPSSEAEPSTDSVITSMKSEPEESAKQRDERSLMQELRRVQNSDPVRALELAREGNRLYPESTYAAERAGRIVKSLALQGKFSQARGEAEKMVNTYLGTAWALEVERHTGAHPRVRMR